MLDVDINPGGIAGGSGGQYFVGTFDGTRFVADNPADRTRWVDYGKDFYASLSFSDMPASDGRRIWMAWMSNWQYANDEPTAPWRGVQSIPRALTLRRGRDGLRLVQAPVAELERLRATPQPRAIAGNDALPPSAEIQLEVKPGDWTRGRGPSVEQRRRGGDRGRDPRRRSRCSSTGAGRGDAVPRRVSGRHAGPVAWRDGTITLRILFDRSVIEVFANDGETVDHRPRLPHAAVRPAGAAASGGAHARRADVDARRRSGLIFTPMMRSAFFQ